MQGKTALVVDDGMATGSTVFAACQVARCELGAKRVVLAVPAALVMTVRIAEEVADEIVCLESPTPFFGVGLWYHDFTQVSDEEVVALLQRAASGPARPGVAPCGRNRRARSGLRGRTRPRRRGRC